MTYWMGIDGGGSGLRIVIVDDDLTEIAFVAGAAVNPGGVGRQVALERIRAGVRDALELAGLSTVTGAAIGVAGAAADHAGLWLVEVVGPLLPNATIIPSSDEEIALVGARGQRQGVVLLSGTGSVCYGVNDHGDTLRAGGWGYLLGDEGSGYWIGAQALRTVTLHGDGRLNGSTALPGRIMAQIGITRPVAVIEWTYHTAKPPDVAALASVVLALADDGDPAAQAIVEQAAHDLTNLARHVLTTLDLPPDALAYAGSLLTTDNTLHRAVTSRLGLDAPPVARYSAVVGAALLARLRVTASRADQV